MPNPVVFKNPESHPQGLSLDELFKMQDSAELSHLDSSGEVIRGPLVSKHARWSVMQREMGEGYVHPEATHDCEGKTVRYALHFGKEPVETKAEGSTAMDLWLAADKLIQASGDLHHVFIEGFVFTSNPDVIELYTGS